MKNIYLIRHCKAEGQEPNAQLTPIGQEQAIQLADALEAIPLKMVVTSPFMRTVQTIQPLCDRLGLAFVTDHRLEERVLSAHQLDNWMELLKQTYEDMDMVLDGGESSMEAMSRGVAVIQELIEGPHQHSAVVTHGALLSLILRHFDPSVGFEEWRALTNPDVYVLRYRPGDVKLIRLWQEQS